MGEAEPESDAGVGCLNWCGDFFLLLDFTLQPTQLNRP